jgi:hypothetical protein
MLLSAVSVLVVAQSSSEIPEGLMNNPVFARHQFVVSKSVVDICTFVGASRFVAGAVHPLAHHG